MVRHFGEKVYKLVRQIPKGKVVTYGQIATIIQKSKVQFKIQNQYKVYAKTGWFCSPSK